MARHGPVAGTLVETLDRTVGRGGASMIRQLREFLDSHKIKYAVLPHSHAITAQQIAASAHIPGKELAKTVVVKLDGKTALAVLPASQKVDFELLQEAAAAKHAELATEEEFRDRFPDCDLGAMPPFGNLYGLEVYVAEALAEDEEIAFNAGSFTELVRMDYRDFERLVQPKVLRFGTRV
jgi:Ala-tRNA(Pro) deacylase